MRGRAGRFRLFRRRLRRGLLHGRLRSRRRRLMHRRLRRRLGSGLLHRGLHGFRRGLLYGGLCLLRLDGTRRLRGTRLRLGGNGKTGCRKQADQNDGKYFHGTLLHMSALLPTQRAYRRHCRTKKNIPDLVRKAKLPAFRTKAYLRPSCGPGFPGGEAGLCPAGRSGAGDGRCTSAFGRGAGAEGFTTGFGRGAGADGFTTGFGWGGAGRYVPWGGGGAW